MAYEIINNAQITPMRLFALLRLVSEYPGNTEKWICELLQPPELHDNTNAATSALDAAVKCGLLDVDQDRKYYPSINMDKPILLDQYRTLMQKRLLGVKEEEKNNFLLNIFVAWYTVLDEKALTYEKMDFLAVDFNNKVFPNSQGRAINETKLRGMDDWLSFLGFGWNWDRGDYFLIPDATYRIEPLLTDLIPTEDWVPLGKFMHQLADRCPELDRGILNEQCWSAMYGERVRGNQISLMVSTALRTLESSGQISLDNVSDTGDQWTLYDDVTSKFTVITHIRRGK